MPNKDRNKRSVRKARAAERERVEVARATSAPASSDKAKGGSKPAAAPKADKPAKATKSGKPGLWTRMVNYFAAVRVEMHRVVWPSKEELKSYSLAVIVMLVVFGVVVWLVDTGIVSILVGYTGLRPGV